jgi:5'-3' exonuclease
MNIVSEGVRTPSLRLFDYRGYRQAYYRKSFGKESSEMTEKEMEKMIDKMCYLYIKSFVWVYEYYCNGILSWGWYYPYHYAPLMKDLMRTVESYSKIHSSETFFNELRKFDSDRPAPPFQHLLCVLPPRSASLLPKHLSHLLSESSPLGKKGYFPKTWTIDYEGKTAEYMAISILTFANVSFVREIYEQTYNPRKRYIRNERPEGIGYVFSSSSEQMIYRCKFETLKINVKCDIKY